MHVGECLKKLQEREVMDGANDNSDQSTVDGEQVSPDSTKISQQGSEKILGRLKKRVARLRQHHNECAARYNLVEDNIPEEPEPPPLERTESVFLTKKMLDITESSSNESVSDEDKEYVPETSGETDGSSDEEPLKKQAQTPPRKVYKRVRQLPEGDESAEESSSTSVVVMNVKKLKDGTKKYHQKRNYCLFCDKSYLKIARHLEQRHSDETEVARALACPKKSKQRRLQLDYLRKRGNRAHNVEAIKEGKGVVVPCKQSSDAGADATEYQHCPNCQGFFKRRFLWKHMKRCALSQKCGKAKPGKTRVQSLCAFAQPVPDGVSTRVWKIISNMCQDKVAQVVQKDRCIIALAQQMLNKKGASQDEHIRATLRELGRLVLAGQEVTPLRSIEQYVMPSNFNHLITAVKAVAGYDENTNTTKKSNLALKLGHSIKKIADLVACEALISGNQDKAKLIGNFHEIFRTRWNEFISASAYRTLQEAKWNAPQLIPFTDDVKKLHLHLDEKQEEYFNMLSAEQTSRNWTNLAKVILAKVILFNRRRQGEVSKMLLATFLSRVSTPVHDDVAHALSEVEKMLCKYFSRMEIRGKRGRKVPVLLTPTMVQALDLLAKERSDCGILPDNDFLFARPGSASHLKGSDCIRVFAKECGAKQPQALSSTKLRKQVSTLSKVLNLTDTELDQLAEFLGHDIRIHRQYYRLPEGTLQLAKISKILMACEQGRLADFKGKTLEEITIEPSETVQAVTEELDDDEENLEEESIEASGSSSCSSHMTRQGDSDSSVAPSQVSADVSESSSSSEMFQLHSDSDSSVRPQRCSTPKGSSAFKPSPSTSSNSGVSQRSASSAEKTSKTTHSDQAPSTKRKWSDQEVAAVESKLGRYIKQGTTPGKEECEECIRSCPEALKNRDWRAVKYYVRNRIVSLTRKT